MIEIFKKSEKILAETKNKEHQKYQRIWKIEISCITFFEEFNLVSNHYGKEQGNRLYDKEVSGEKIEF